MYINKNKVSVYKKNDKYFIGKLYDYTRSDYWMFTEKILSVKPKKVFTGKIKEDDDTLFTGEKLEGNSILIKLTEKSYIIIEKDIYCFETKEPIENFYCTIDSNGVISPSATTKNYMYLFSGYMKSVYLPLELFTNNKSYNSDLYYKQEPILLYYGFSKAKKQKNEKKIKIKKIYSSYI